MTIRASNLTTGRWFGAMILMWTPSAVRADIVTDWNQLAIRATGIAGAPVPVQTRAMSIVPAAIFDAVNAIDLNYPPSAADVRPERMASADPAAVAAAHGILGRLYPPQKAIT